MRELVLTILALLINFTLALGQVNSLKCDSTLLQKGRVFKGSNPKSLEGIYKLTIIPTWEPTAKKVTGELHLFWENHYKSMQTDSALNHLVNFPLVGYAIGNFKNATRANFNKIISRKNPMNPGIRFFPEFKVLTVPGGQVFPSCLSCVNMNADNPGIDFFIKKDINGVLVGKWNEGFGILEIVNSEGKKISYATGFFYAEPIN